MFTRMFIQVYLATGLGKCLLSQSECTAKNALLLILLVVPKAIHDALLNISTVSTSVLRAGLRARYFSVRMRDSRGSRERSGGDKLRDQCEPPKRLARVLPLLQCAAMSSSPLPFCSDDDIDFLKATVVKAIEADRAKPGREHLPKEFNARGVRVGLLRKPIYDLPVDEQILVWMVGYAVEKGTKIPYVVEALFFYDWIQQRYHEFDKSGTYDLDTWCWESDVADDGIPIPRGKGGFFKLVADADWIRE